MFSIGEICLVLIVALIVLGPKQLPTIAQYLGKAIKKFRQFSTGGKKIFDDLIAEQKLQDNEMRAQAADKRYQRKSANHE